MIKTVITEFKEFISRGNVIDLAVGVIMGSAFSKIVTSVVNDLIMPFIGIALGGIDFSNINLVIKDAEIRFGTLLQNIIDFLIIAFCIFVLVKMINKLMPKKEVPKPAPKKEENIVLLEEIRDLLKEKEVKKTVVKKTTKKEPKEKKDQI